MRDMNLLEETINILKENNHTPDEVLWVGNDTCKASWDEFAHIAQHIDYDEGFGVEWVNRSLVVVGSDWWLERHEYDGKEWWEFKSLPIAPTVEGLSIYGIMNERYFDELTRPLRIRDELK